MLFSPSKRTGETPFPIFPVIRCTYSCCRQTGVGKRVWTNFGQTAQAYLRLSLRPSRSSLNCPVAVHALGGFRLSSLDKECLRHATVPRLWSSFMMAFRTPIVRVVSQSDRAIDPLQRFAPPLLLLLRTKRHAALTLHIMFSHSKKHIVEQRGN